MTKNKYIIPHFLEGKEFYCKKPDWYRKTGGRFTINEQLSDKDIEYIISQGCKVIKVQPNALSKSEEEKVKRDIKTKPKQRGCGN